MNHQQILAIYEEVAGITSKMLDAARDSDWDSLISLEAHCANRINILKVSDQRPPMNENERQRKLSIIKKILADDNEIRTITEPRLAQLASLISSSGNERKLNHAYISGRTG